MDFVILTVVLLLALGAYWSLVVYPKQYEFSKRQKFVRTLAEGDEVITAGGIIGKVIEIRGDEGIAIVELAPGLRVRAVTASLLQAFDPEELARNVQMAIKEPETTGEAQP
jgi:preprotein translocase subunit YajC